jgi:putative heme transporter
LREDDDARPRGVSGTDAGTSAPVPDDAERTDRRPTVPDALRIAGAWSWRLLLIGAVVYFATQLAATLGALVMSLFGGLLLTALLRPGVNRLARWGLPRLAATWLLLLTTITALAGVGWLIERRISAQLPALRQNLATGLDRLRDLLVDTFGLPPERLGELTSTLAGAILGTGPGVGPAGVVQGATRAATVLGGVALALFTAFWLVYDGERVGRWIVRLLPDRAQDAAGRAAGQAWHTLGDYLRGVTIVALIDAVGIGIALVLIGVPLPLALAVLTFLGAYVPLIGATLAGAAAVLVALAANGLTDALLTLAAVVAVQQIEGNVLHPVIVGHTLTLHPLAIIYALTAGTLLYGIGGAVLAVPITAAVHAFAVSLTARGDP